MFPVSLISTFPSVLYLNARNTTTISEDHIATQFSSGTKHTIFSDFCGSFPGKKKKGFFLNRLNTGLLGSFAKADLFQSQEPKSDDYHMCKFNNAYIIIK